VRYYLLAILFIIFDLEIAFLFPWAVVFQHIGIVALIEMALFLLLLVVGFAYVWKKGALEWE
jgi:NADH-quinone oxidoreductase subunit A